METLVNELISIIFGSANPGVLAILMIAVSGLAYIVLRRETAHSKERKEVINQFQTQIEHDREELFKILEKYQEGQLSVVQAMNEIKILIATLGAKI